MKARFKRLTIAVAIAAAVSAPGAYALSDDTTRDLDAIGSPIRPAPADPVIAHALQQISPQQIQHTIETLVGFHTRNTLSSMTKDLPAGQGVSAAADWIESEFKRYSDACGGCFEVKRDTFTESPQTRVPQPTTITNVYAILRGSDPVQAKRMYLVTGHYDSRNTDVLDTHGEAPGANDDASGVAAVLEAARILSAHHFPATIVYSINSGEEQGLYGGKVLADYAKAQGWRVEAVLNNDIVGGTHGADGRVVDGEVRVFSEGTRADETPAEAADRRRSGAEMDAPSREVARFMRRQAEAYTPALRVRMILRHDRFGRGGDQLPMQQAGFPAVRITEADENYTRQHQDVRTENGIAYGDVISGVDFPYLAKVTALNTVTLAALASAPPPPTDLKLAGAVTADTTLSWAPAPGASDYRVWWRETTEPFWRDDQSRATAGATTMTLKGINIDDYVFGVSSRGSDGSESPVEFPGPAGAFVRQ